MGKDTYVPVKRGRTTGVSDFGPKDMSLPRPVPEDIEYMKLSDEQMTVKRWNEVIYLLKGLEEQWDNHLEGLNWLETTDYLPEDLQGHLAQIFTHAEFYTALPQLVDYIRAVGGIENLFVKEAKEDNARSD